VTVLYFPLDTHIRNTVVLRAFKGIPSLHCIAIAASREGMRPTLVSRGHKLVRIYAANSPATDLLVSGSFNIALTDGNSVELDFTARFLVASEEDEEGKLKYVEVWTDPAEMIEAFKKAQAALDAKE
jgi:hypothetical protein